ncbi:glycosyltransferase family 1 protein [Candidatus Microgenomates bacterium]|nr:MAG: glycosyltransferase family 1 protein [Candidatus Microgenomates bacterium]
MIIGFDATMLVYQGSGVATYTHSLLVALLKADKKNNYKIFYSSLRHPEAVKHKLKMYKNLGAKVYDFSIPHRIIKMLWNRFHILPIELLIGHIDILISSDFFRPPSTKKVRGFTTIHDLTWKVFPEYHQPQIVAAHQRKINRTIAYHDTIIVDSINTGRDLLKYYPNVNNTNKIHTLPLGVDERFRRVGEEQIAAILRKYKLRYPARYLLYVGAIEPRKNLDRVIKLFNQLIQESQFADFKLLVVGRAGWNRESIFQLVHELKLEEQVIFTGYVIDEDLVGFYNAAKVTLYLSSYEGFGLPPLESARCGTPFLTYRHSSMVEYFNASIKNCFTIPGNELQSLKRVIDGKADLKDRLITVASLYSWDEYVHKLITMYSNNHKY